MTHESRSRSYGENMIMVSMAATVIFWALGSTFWDWIGGSDDTHEVAAFEEFNPSIWQWQVPWFQDVDFGG